MWLIDFTCVSVPAIPQITPSIRAEASALGIDDLFFVLNGNSRSQKNALSRVLQSSPTEYVDVPWQDRAELARELAKLVVNKVIPPGIDVVYSNNPAVEVALAQALSADAEVTFRPFPRESESIGQGDWPEDFIPIDDALSILYSVLTPNGLRRTDIRGMLASRDSRFDKSSKDTRARTPRLISMLIEEAKRRHKVVEHHAQHPSNGLISLSSNVVSRDLARGNDDDRFESPQPLSVQGFSVLRADDMGPFSEVRWHVYEEIAKAVKDDPTVPADKAINDALEKVRANDGVTLPKGKKYAWGNALNFLYLLFSKSAVLGFTGDDEAALTIDNREKPLVRLADEWQYRLDGELVIHLLGKGVTVAGDRLDELAGLLYCDRRYEAQRRAARVLRLLKEADRIQDHDGVYRRA
ncbi:MAG: hypothetical protein LBC97_14005 [Bifidobacteriaceae bacterium]|jgi:hypothetical protein|nr:hypothetical protein [Bifidobacteriaceae bacterium]